MDFTIKIYKELLLALKDQGYSFQTFEQFIVNPLDHKTVVLRHDVDRIPANALKMAEVESALSVQATYYFRVVPSVWHPPIMKSIVDLGHELSYHYEDLSITKGDYEAAISHFKVHLEKFRRLYPSKTICMHGSPMSNWDNRKLWTKYDYRDFGIIAEPYFDVDYSKVFYLTDTGRSWNNDSVNVRDIVNSGFDIKIGNTGHLVRLIKNGQIPNKLIINTHPHRWFDFGLGWTKELIFQNLKNIVKLLLIKIK